MPLKSLTALIALALSLTLGAGCQSSRIDTQEPTVRFAGLSFTLPAPPKVIALPSERGDFLIFKYSNQPGRDYLAFSLEAAIEDSCSSEQFFQAVINPELNTLCNSHAVRVFTQQFADQYPAELWPNSEYNAYYFQTHDQRQFVFIPLAADKLLKIDSDYFSKQQMRSLVGRGE